jgi:hypothetical protein
MPVTPGPQFNKPPQEAPTLGKVVTEFEHNPNVIPSLLPEKEYLYVARTGTERDEQDPTDTFQGGVTIGVVGPQMYKYDEAEEEDPGALFSYYPPMVDHMYRTKGAKGIAPSLLGLADKEMRETHGVGLQIDPDASLSQHSSALVDKLASHGLTSPSPGITNTEDFDDGRDHVYQDHTKYETLDSTPGRTSETKNGLAKKTSVAERPRPLGEALAEGRAQLRGVLKGPKAVPVVSRGYKPRHARPISNMPGQGELF